MSKIVNQLLPLDADQRLSFLILLMSRDVIWNNCDQHEPFLQLQCLFRDEQLEIMA